MVSRVIMNRSCQLRIMTTWNANLCFKSLIIQIRAIPLQELSWYVYVIICRRGHEFQEKSRVSSGSAINWDHLRRAVDLASTRRKAMTSLNRNGLSHKLAVVFSDWLSSAVTVQSTCPQAICNAELCQCCQTSEVPSDNVGLWNYVKACRLSR
jgi:hypothetical protein